MEGYCLSLNPRFSWNLTAEPGLRGWLDRLASIMEMRPCTDASHPRVLFRVPGNNRNPSETGGPRREEMGLLPAVRCRTLHIIPRPSGDVEMEVDNRGGVEAETANMWSAMFPVYHKAAVQGGMAIHAALAETGGRGVLFAGASGTGKSTCCRRLPRHWRVLCDDLTVVLKGKEGGYEGHPFPTWSDYLPGGSGENTWDARRASPLRAVFFLEKHLRNEIIPIKGGWQAPLLINGSATQAYHYFRQKTGDRERLDMTRRLFQNACDMARTVSAYILRLSLTGRFWELIEKECL